ncbi:LysR substrate-binding domain-containing protein [Varunaivibrio sulfuroxidans]|uniref:LysR substrate-binding domain-containing protein n=1 Tax=Varunaivibrio sulfuroxidans TaxID=1773489 RepID=UPI001FB239F2|nr:LysR substrate-binding domain-containing protein [Varunaivibrio sulfuroxidans]WES32189.1 LysR substrate-binding domain-containing protein [Varunaivibrio sulfuroxidans]
MLLGTPGNADLNRGEADIAVRLSRPEEADLIVRRIGIMRFALYATPLLAKTPEAQWTFVGYSPDLEHVTQQAWLRSLLDGRSIVFQASDLFGQQEAARAGLGAVVLPHFMGDPDPSLVRVPTRTPPPSATCGSSPALIFGDRPPSVRRSIFLSRKSEEAARRPSAHRKNRACLGRGRSLGRRRTSI